MNAHPAAHWAAPELSAVQQLCRHAERLAALSFSIGQCTTAEEADAQADTLEAQARSMHSACRRADNDGELLTFLTVAGDYARRARLFRDRARELRS